MAADDINGPRVRDISGDKWKGPSGGPYDPTSVADELQYDALPEGTRALAERVGACRAEAAADGGYSVGWNDGKAHGKALAEKEWAAEKAALETRASGLDQWVVRLQNALTTIVNRTKIQNVEDAQRVAKAALVA